MLCSYEEVMLDEAPNFQVWLKSTVDRVTSQPSREQCSTAMTMTSALLQVFVRRPGRLDNFDLHLDLELLWQECDNTE